MGAFLGDCGLIGAVLVIRLIDIQGGVVESSPESEGQPEDEELIQPTILEGLADQPPTSLHKWLSVPARDDLGLAT